MHGVESCATINPCQGGELRNPLTTCVEAPLIPCGMRKTKPGSRKLADQARNRLKMKQPARPHFIEEWATRSGYNDQAALVEALGADKSVISRWYSGTSPGRGWQLKLCALFGHPNQTDIIFQHPDTIWTSGFLKGRSEDEVERIKRVMEDLFPPGKPGA